MRTLTILILCGAFGKDPSKTRYTVEPQVLGQAWDPRKVSHSCPVTEVASHLKKKGDSKKMSQLPRCYQGSSVPPSGHFRGPVYWNSRVGLFSGSAIFRRHQVLKTYFWLTKLIFFCSLNVEMLQLQFSPRFYVGESPTPESRKGTVKKCPSYQGVPVTRVLLFLPHDILEDPSIEIELDLLWEDSDLLQRKKIFWMCCMVCYRFYSISVLKDMLVMFAVISGCVLGMGACGYIGNRKNGEMNNFLEVLYGKIWVWLDLSWKFSGKKVVSHD